MCAQWAKSELNLIKLLPDGPDVMADVMVDVMADVMADGPDS